MNLPAITTVDTIQSRNGSVSSSVKFYEHVLLLGETGQSDLGDNIHDHCSDSSSFNKVFPNLRTAVMVLLFTQ